MDTTAQHARSLLRIGSVALALLLAVPAVAQEVTGDKRRASALVDEGNQLFAAKHYEAAQKKYEAAYAAYPSPKILLNLAEVHRELGQPERAVERYERFLADSDPSTDGKHRDAAEQRIRELEAQLGRVAIEGPRGLAVALDGKPLGKLPVPPVRVAGGRHTVTADGFREDVMVRSGRIETVRIIPPEEATPPIARAKPPAPAAAAPVARAAPPAPVPAPPPAVAPAAPGPAIVAAPREHDEDDGEGGVLGAWWFWTGVGVVAASAVVVGVAASSSGDDFVPGGELGRVSTADWQTFSPGGGQ